MITKKYYLILINLFLIASCSSTAPNKRKPFMIVGQVEILFDKKGIIITSKPGEAEQVLFLADKSKIEYIKTVFENIKMALVSEKILTDQHELKEFDSFILNLN